MKKFSYLEETGKAGAVDAKKQLVIHKPCNPHVATCYFNSEILRQDFDGRLAIVAQTPAIIHQT